MTPLLRVSLGFACVGVAAGFAGVPIANLLLVSSIVISLADLAVHGPDGNRSLHIINGYLVWRSKE